MFEKHKNAEIINLPNFLKEKVGQGGIPEHLVKQASTFIQENNIDFSPFALKHLENIRKILSNLKSEKQPDQKKERLEEIIENIMLIKAHGGMFNFDIMSKISGTALTFLEDIKDFNDDLYQIIDAHNHTIHLIIKSKLKGNGGDQGNALLKEFQEAISRYKKRYNL